MSSNYVKRRSCKRLFWKWMSFSKTINFCTVNVGTIWFKSEANKLFLNSTKTSSITSFLLFLFQLLLTTRNRSEILSLPQFLRTLAHKDFCPQFLSLHYHSKYYQVLHPMIRSIWKEFWAKLPVYKWIVASWLKFLILQVSYNVGEKRKELQLTIHSNVVKVPELVNLVKKWEKAYEEHNMFQNGLRYFVFNDQSQQSYVIKSPP